MSRVRMTFAVTCILISMAQGSAAAAKEDYGMKDLNIDIVVSVVGQPIPEQMIAPMTKDQKYNKARALNFSPKPLPYVAGSRLKLKIEAVSLDGKREDITNSKFVTIFTTDYVLHLCQGRHLCLWPEGKSIDFRSDPLTARYGDASIKVEYTTPDGKIGFNGFVIDVLPKHPSDVLPSPLDKESADTRTREPAKPDKELPATAWRDLINLNGIEVNVNPNNPTQMIIFFDSNCPYSAELWQRLYGKDSKHKQVASFWVPVAYMHQTSLGKAAYLLEQRSPQALSTNFERFEEKNRQGGTPEARLIPKTRQAIEQNAAQWNKLFGATPLMVYRMPNQKIYWHMGLPEEKPFEDLLKKLSPPKADPVAK